MVLLFYSDKCYFVFELSKLFSLSPSVKSDVPRDCRSDCLYRMPIWTWITQLFGVCSAEEGVWFLQYFFSEITEFVLGKSTKFSSISFSKSIFEDKHLNYIHAALTSRFIDWRTCKSASIVYSPLWSRYFEAYNQKSTRFWIATHGKILSQTIVDLIRVIGTCLDHGVHKIPCSWRVTSFFACYIFRSLRICFKFVL